MLLYFRKKLPKMRFQATYCLMSIFGWFFLKYEDRKTFSKKLKQMLNFKEIIFLALANKISKHNCLIFDLSLKKMSFHYMKQNLPKTRDL